MAVPQPLTDAELQAAREGKSEQIMKGKKPQPVTRPSPPVTQLPTTKGTLKPRPVTEAELQAAREGKSGPHP